MSDAHRAHYRRWAEPFFRDVRGAVGAGKSDLCHLWHGSLRDRRYRQRHDSMRQFDFDPDADLQRDASDLWKWKSNKPALHQFVRHYFASRREDDAPEPVVPRRPVKSDDLSSFGNAKFTGG
jgi:hypothetical protein